MKRNFILTGLLLSTFLAAIEGTVIGPAGPRIVGDLGGVELLSWVFTAYLLTMAVTTPIFGKISDLYGRKLVFVIGSVLFLAGSLLCGFAFSMEQLIVYRAIQGIGAGALIPVTFTIIGDIYAIEERGKIQGYISSVWGISSLVGPLLGGYVVDAFNWRWVFGFNIPFGIISLIFIIKYLHEHIEKRKVKIDYAGAVTFTVGVTALLFGLAAGGQQLAWTSPVLLLIFALAILALVLFFLVEKKAEEPLVPLHMFKYRDIAFSNIASLLASALLIGLTSYFPLWVQGVLGESATKSGLLLAPMSFSWLIGSVVGGKWIVTYGSRFTSLVGMFFIAVGAIGMAFITDTTSSGLLMFWNALYGLGFGFAFTVFTVIAQSSVGFSLRGASTALNSFVKALGQTIGVAVFGVLINQQVASQAEESRNQGMSISQDDINKLLSPEKLVELPRDLWNTLRHFLEGGLHLLFVIMAVLAVLGVISVIGLRNNTPSVEASDTAVEDSLS
ncbi:MDR family MFS transporter [Paenibacillus shirakamiensis]|uniref:MDR family MFS transporter n=1 Tax=Paenibacillus shirakamiensis TaxID=1265935 RepID=UPI001AE9C6B4|nr:MDR family MFS transporter [Paenibacillus shirakamiensis]